MLTEAHLQHLGEFCLEILLLVGLMRGEGISGESIITMIASCQNGKKGIRLTVRTRQDCQKYREWLPIVKSSHCSTPIFRAGLFTVTNLWEQPKCPAMNEWVKKLIAILIIENYANCLGCCHVMTNHHGAGPRWRALSTPVSGVQRALRGRESR